MIKIFLIEKQKIVREGLKVLLEEESDFKLLTSDDKNGKDVKISLINQFKPDLILISLEDLDDADFSYLNIFCNLDKYCDQIQHFELPKIIVFASKVDQLILNKILQLDCAGYLLKESSIEELKQAIRSVYNGYKHIGNSVFSQIKQLSLLDESAKDLENRENSLVEQREHFHSGLLTTSSNELVVEKVSLNTQDIKTPITEKSVAILPPTESSSAKSQNRFPGIVSSLLLTSLGGAAVIVGLLSFGYSKKSYNPISEYGVVQGEIVTIKPPYLGKINQLDYQLGDLVEAEEIIAKLEPQLNSEQRKIITEISQQIENTEQQIAKEQQLLATIKSKLVSQQQRIQQLTAKNLEIESSIKLKQQEGKIADISPLNNTSGDVNAALTNYQTLSKTKGNKVNSTKEVDNDKQVGVNAENKLIKLENSQQERLSEFLKIADKQKKENQQKLEYLQENIKLLQAQIKEKENTIDFLHQGLEHANEHFLQVKDSYQKQQIVDIKTPATGILYQLNQNANDILDKDHTLAEILDCHNLWVELIVDNKFLDEIDFQQSVTLNIDNIQKIAGNISLIKPFPKTEPYLNFDQDYSKDIWEQVYDLPNNSLDKSGDQKLLYKIKIDFSIPDLYTQHHRLCNLGQAAIVTFNSQ